MFEISPTRNQRRPSSRLAFLAVATMACVSSLSYSSSGSDGGATDNDVREAEAKAREAEAKARRAKAELKGIVEQLDAWQQARADEERRRQQEKAAVEHREIEKKIAGQKDRLEQLKKLRRWALQMSTQEQEEWDNAPDPPVWSKQLDRWKRSRQLARTQFLHFPEKSRGAVKSGRALNFFLDACGQAALEHETFLRQARAELKMATSPEQQHIAREKVTFLEGIGGTETLSEHDRQRIRCEMGGAGPKLIINLNDDPLPLDWPVLFRREPDFVPLCEAIREAKEAAIDEIARRGGVQPQTMNQLTDAVDALKLAFDKKYREFLSGKREENNAVSRMPYLNAKKFAIGLRHGVLRLLEARMEEDVQIGKFEKETVGELLAFMCRNGLRFAEADTNGERTYARLFRMMTGYYSDLYSLEIATEDAERQLALLQQREALLTNVMYRGGNQGGLNDVLKRIWRLL